MKIRRNKLILLAFALQVMTLLSVIAVVCGVSRGGQTVVLQMTGYDPYDALRGRYIRLNMLSSDVPLDPDSAGQYETMRNTHRPVYVILEKDPDTGISKFSYASLKRPDNTTPYIKCRSRYIRTYGGEPHADIQPRINRYYLNEKSADQLDQSIGWDTEIRLSLKIWRGMYVIDSIEIDGQRY